MPSASDRLTITVTQLNEYIKSLMNGDPLLRGLSLRGEISNFKRHSSGHLYFSLKDAQSVIRCVMFKQNAFSLRFAPRDGMQVVLRGYVSVYPRDGQYQFYCEGMTADGVGALYQQFERNKARFTEEGLFDPAHKKPLPELAHRIGVVTSPTGAVIRDIIRVSHRRNPNVDILLYPCKVQGEGAAASIVKGIRELDKQGLDVIIAGRGGGSLEDLWAFNEEEVVRAVYACATPIISAVGHETDFALSDFAADARASTPSNAAELAVVDIRDAMQHLDDAQTALKSAALHSIEMRMSQLRALKERAAFRNAHKVFGAHLEQVLQQKEKLEQTALRSLQAKSASLDTLAARLRALDPEAVLKRGYAIAKLENKPVTSVNAVHVGDMLNVRVSDGEIAAKVERIEGERA